MQFQTSNLLFDYIISCLVKMRFSERDQSSKRSYQRISLAKRKRLVQVIINEGLSLSKVSKKLKLKLTTARLILKKYKETGSFPMRNFKKKAEKIEKSDELKTFNKELQEQQIQSAQEKEEDYEDIIIEQPPIICYYFVNQMPALIYFPQFWPGYTLPLV